MVQFFASQCSSAADLTTKPVDTNQEVDVRDRPTAWSLINIH